MKRILIQEHSLNQYLLNSAVKVYPVSGGVCESQSSTYAEHSPFASQSAEVVIVPSAVMVATEAEGSEAESVSLFFLAQPPPSTAMMKRTNLPRRGERVLMNYCTLEQAVATVAPAWKIDEVATAVMKFFFSMWFIF